MTNATVTNNPLLIGKGLPPFDKIKAEHISPAIEQLLAELEIELANLEANVTPTWAGLVEPLTQIEERLTWSWGIVGHLMGVKNSPEVRQAYESVQPQVVQFSSQLSQSKPLYEAFKALRESKDYANLENAQKRVVEAAIRDAELSGVGLEGEKRERFNQIQLELAELSTKFSNNVLDATKAFKLKLTTKQEIDGLPASLLSLAAQTARAEGEENATPEEGPWVITLDYPSYLPFMKYSTNRELREKLYKAFITRASSGELDNNPLMERILQLRQEKANLLGYNSYAEVSLARKMAPGVEAVEKLLQELCDESYNAAVRELEDLKAFANTYGERFGHNSPDLSVEEIQNPKPPRTKRSEEQRKIQNRNDDLKHWDIAYWSEKQREAKFDFNAEELRPYFPLPRVLEGLFGLAKRIFGVTIVPADGQAPVWQEDVRYFQVNNEAGDAIAYFYLDPYSRPAEKRGGAWMDDCIGRAKMVNGIRLPVAYLICYKTHPIDD